MEFSEKMATFSHSAGGIVLNEHDDVLLVMQRDGSWSFPKGTLNDGEDPRDCALREIMEESGLRDVRMARMLKSYNRYSLTDKGRTNPDRFKRMTMYLFRTNETALAPMDPRIAEARWVPQVEVTRLLANPYDQEFFEEVLPGLQPKTK